MCVSDVLYNLQHAYNVECRAKEVVMYPFTPHLLLLFVCCFVLISYCLVECCFIAILLRWKPRHAALARVSGNALQL